MTMMMKMLAGAAGLAAFAAAAPASGQYGYGYGYSNVTRVAADRCAAAVQNRLSYSQGTNIFGIRLGSNAGARVLNVTQVNPNRNSVRVRGLATSGAAYAPYGVGAYGMLGSNYAQRPDLSFKCDVDYRGYVRDVDINRR